jgi:KUP system potassium uptake protein
MTERVTETATVAEAAHAGTGREAPPTMVALALGSVGVVYGDIGTSPLYAFREAVMAASHAQGVTREVVLGVLSMIVWALIITVTLKYVLLLLRADNNGEGGTLSLTALAMRAIGRRTAFISILGVVGAAMFLGDSVITPAISVLSAVEGLKLASPAFGDVVAPLAVFVLIALFAAQSRGTAKVAALFGPVMVVWFIAIAVAGALHIRDDPNVLYALNPLYADLGHFGRKPIQIAWLCLVLPSLLINYFGQGAKVLADPGAIENPFYRLVPDAFILPMVVLATAATVIASQAVITGAYSLVHQAIRLGLLPRLAILHTSASHVGQIYIPRVTIALLIGVLLLVGLFRTSSALASAYGIAVATTMVVDGLLAFFVFWKLWQWPLWKAVGVMLPFVIVDVTFFSANFMKLFEGAWAPLLFGAGMVLLILTWRRGTGILASKTRRTEVPMDTLFRMLEKKPPHIVPGTAVFLTSDPEFSPTALLHNLKHNKVLHENNVILTINTADTPRVPEEERVQITPLSAHFSRVTLKFGYMEQPNVPKALAIARKHGWQFDIMSTSFFLSRRSLKPSAKSGMPSWQDHLFIWLARSASDATDFFQIPTGRVVEVGTQVTV